MLWHLSRNATYFPANALPQHEVGGHNPVLPPMPCDVEEDPPRGRRLALDGVSEERWGDLDVTVLRKLMERLGDAGTLYNLTNVDYVLNVMATTINDAFQAHFSTI